MYTTLKVLYADGTQQRLETEPMGRNMAKELMNYVFYHQSDDTGGSQIVQARFFQRGRGKPLSIQRSAL